MTVLPLIGGENTFSPHQPHFSFLLQTSETQTIIVLLYFIKAVWSPTFLAHDRIIIASYYLIVLPDTLFSHNATVCVCESARVLINFNYCVPSHLKALFCPRNCPQPLARRQALTFITCEGLILSAAVACLFINHSPDNQMLIDGRDGLVWLSFSLCGVGLGLPRVQRQFCGTIVTSHCVCGGLWCRAQPGLRREIMWRAPEVQHLALPLLTLTHQEP